MGYLGKKQPQGAEGGQATVGYSGNVYHDIAPAPVVDNSPFTNPYEVSLPKGTDDTFIAPSIRSPPTATFASLALVNPSNRIAIAQKDRISGTWTIDTELYVLIPTPPVFGIRNPFANLSLRSSSGLKADIQVVANDGALRPTAVIDCIATSKKAIVRIVSRDHQRIKLSVTSDKSDVYLALPDDYSGYITYTMTGAKKPKDTFSHAIMDHFSMLETGSFTYGPVRGTIGEAGDFEDAEKVDEVNVEAKNGKLYLSYYSQDFGTNPFTWGYSQGKEGASRND
ncbi:uncharacterized protein EI90DRAFT_3056797 [Cantharellus anzutake]|uniref:uncharacterized protein n=1 Tax=Cantharellus anzutake TaxID=1750568 RepID=UPI0019036F77|nr:uncharacterized protein EI90DRAFT_3056797 [Cantharellus anzutake]KAF8331650.1 hypothetical protein EI90DRAFT_3056797 [Cantharellus anzutake]